jgi:hypothetical protein
MSVQKARSFSQTAPARQPNDAGGTGSMPLLAEFGKAHAGEILLVRAGGVEPPRAFAQRILSPLRLPFRHARFAPVLAPWPDGSKRAGCLGSRGGGDGWGNLKSRRGVGPRRGLPAHRAAPPAVKPKFLTNGGQYGSCL